MVTGSWSRSTTERKAAWKHYGDVAVRTTMWKYDDEGDCEHNDEESRTIIADGNAQLTESSE